MDGMEAEWKHKLLTICTKSAYLVYPTCFPWYHHWWPSWLLKLFLRLRICAALVRRRTWSLPSSSGSQWVTSVSLVSSGRWCSENQWKKDNIWVLRYTKCYYQVTTNKNVDIGSNLLLLFEYRQLNVGDSPIMDAPYGVLQIWGLDLVWVHTIETLIITKKQLRFQ